MVSSITKKTTESVSMMAIGLLALDEGKDGCHEGRKVDLGATEGLLQEHVVDHDLGEPRQQQGRKQEA